MLGGAMFMSSGYIPKKKEFDFRVSLAQWSLHKALFAGDLDNLDFPKKAKQDFDIEAVEYVNQFFSDKATDFTYLGELKKRTDDFGVYNHLIMVDNEGFLANSADENKRLAAVENHYKWIDAAKYLGCKSVRVNLHGFGKAEDWVKASVDSLGRLTEYGAQNNIHVIVENHGSYSSDASLLTRVIREVDSPWCGILTDFNNFCIKREEQGDLWSSPCIMEYDRYKGVEEFMPYAKAVSAKTIAFDENGNEATFDFKRMLTIVRDSGFNGYMSIEWEGENISEDEGITKSKALLLKLQRELSAH